MRTFVILVENGEYVYWRNDEVSCVHRRTTPKITEATVLSEAQLAMKCTQIKEMFDGKCHPIEVFVTRNVSIVSSLSPEFWGAK